MGDSPQCWFEQIRKQFTLQLMVRQERCWKRLRFAFKSSNNYMNGNRKHILRTAMKTNLSKARWLLRITNNIGLRLERG
jgi:hypothetical protein